MKSPLAATTSAAPNGVATSIDSFGYNVRMDKEASNSIPAAGGPEVKKEAREAREGDKPLDEYDKTVADSFPASDPPAQP